MTSRRARSTTAGGKVTAVDELRSFAFEDGFASDDSFTPLEDMPVVQQNV